MSAHRGSAYVDSFPSPARYLVAIGRTYATPLVGDWYEVDSYSDGMCGRIECENPYTTEAVAFHWSVTSPTCQSQEQARDFARRELGADLEGPSAESRRRAASRTVGAQAGNPHAPQPPRCA